MILLRLYIVATILLLASGAREQPKPDFMSLYNRSAQYHGVDRNPVVVIPGILGSKLKAADTGQVVWGAFGGGYADPTTPEGAQLVALPMKKGARLSELKDNVVPDGALDRVELDVFGLPIELNAYYEILSTLGVGGYRDETFGTLQVVDYGDEHYTCFQFDYDWRHDVAETAKKLHDFIIDKRAYVQEQIEKRFGAANADVKFDIVAHSMGGLVTRYFLRYGNQGQAPTPGSNR